MTNAYLYGQALRAMDKMVRLNVATQGQDGGIDHKIAPKDFAGAISITGHVDLPCIIRRMRHEKSTSMWANSWRKLIRIGLQLQPWAGSARTKTMHKSRLGFQPR